MRDDTSNGDGRVTPFPQSKDEPATEDPAIVTKDVKMESGRGFPQQDISIVVADSMAITAELLTQAISKQPGFEICGCPRNMEELVEMISGRAPDVALIRSSDRKGTFTPLLILDTIHNLCPETRSIVLSSEITREEVVAYFHAQARGILSADLTDFATLCKCIRSVYEGEIWASSKHLNFLIESLSGLKPLQVVDGKGDTVLSAREQEVFRLLSEGRSNRAMAAALNLSEHTIKNHLFHIFYKLGVSSRTEAILYAMRRRGLSEQKNAS